MSRKGALSTLEQEGHEALRKLRDRASAGVRANEKTAPPTTRTPPAPPLKIFPDALRPKRRFLEGTSAERKTFPVSTGVLDYFPDAIAAVAEISYQGNRKHNPGEPLHWARGKSMDHADCVGRHLIERGGFETMTLPDGEVVLLRHSASLAWRALALLQEELEAEFGLATPRGATVAVTK
jgi:hypothetical protein